MKKWWCAWLIAVLLGSTAQAETLLFTADLHYGDHAPYADETLASILDESEDADALLILGDIANNGHAEEHQAVQTALQQAAARGARIFVLPGNHDVTAQNAASFAAWYADFGYRQAFSRDAHSLSYAVKLSPTLWLLMLDTCEYGQSNGLLRPETLAWASDLYAQAEKSDAVIVAAGHHPLLAHSYNDANRADLTQNADTLAALVASARLPLYLAGHRHQMHYAAESGLTEILMGVPTLWPNKIGRLTIESDGARFDTVTLEPNAEGFAEAEKTAMEAQAERMAAGALRNTVHAGDADMIAFFEQVYLAYRDGTLFQIADACLRNAAYLRWQDGGITSIFRPWLQYLLESMTEDYNQLNVAFQPLLSRASD